MTHKTFFKEKYFRSPEYLKWIRTQPCEICGMMPCIAAHQRCLGDGSQDMKPPDNKTIPNCENCHAVGEHMDGIMTLWKTKRPEMWGEISDPARRKLNCKQDLREYIAMRCKFYHELWKKEKSK